MSRARPLGDDLEKLQALVPVALKDALEAHAEQRCSSVAELVRRFCVEGLLREGGWPGPKAPPVTPPRRHARGDEQ